MTLTEKLTLIHDGLEDAKSYQVQARYIAGISRLGFQGCASRTDCRDAEAASFAGRDGDHGRGCIFDIRLACNTFGDDPALTSQIDAAGSGIKLQHVQRTPQIFVNLQVHYARLFRIFCRRLQLHWNQRMSFNVRYLDRNRSGMM